MITRAKQNSRWRNILYVWCVRVKLLYDAHRSRLKSATCYMRIVFVFSIPLSPKIIFVFCTATMTAHFRCFQNYLIQVRRLIRACGRISAATTIVGMEFIRIRVMTVALRFAPFKKMIFHATFYAMALDFIRLMLSSVATKVSHKTYIWGHHVGIRSFIFQFILNTLLRWRAERTQGCTAVCTRWSRFEVNHM